MALDFLHFGISLSVAATLLSAPFAFFGKVRFLRHLGNALVVLGTGTGAISAIALLIAGRAPSFSAISPLLRFGTSPLSLAFFAVVNTVACIVSIYAVRYLHDSHEAYHLPNLNGTTSLFIFGMQTTLLAASIPTFMLSWEVMSLASFVLVMADRSAASRRAALLYFAMAHLGAVAIMAGFFVVSPGVPTATFDMVAIGAAGLSPREVLTAFVLFFIGFGSKAGLIPLHIWLPEAHPQAPSHISALMSGVMLKVAVFGFILTCMTLLPGLPAVAALVIMGIGLLSAVFGSLYAAIDRDIKKTLAWSSIENIGIIFLMLGTSLYARSQGMAILAEVAFAAAIFHCIAHALFKSGLFLGAGHIVHIMATKRLERMGGLAKRMPTFSAAFLILCLTAAALPPFAGFIGEWMYLSGLVDALSVAVPSVQIALVIALAGTAFTAGIAVFAMVKLFAISQLGAPRSPAAEAAKDPSWGIRGPIFFLSALAVLSGVFAPAVLKALGSVSVVPVESASMIVLRGSTLSPAALAAFFVAALGMIALAQRMVGRGRERQYRTWDCGQPITPHMEYTATAFSAPIRFFFRSLIGIRKIVVVAPSASASTVMDREVRFTSSSFWVTSVHDPIVRGLHRLGEQARRIQSGSIQLYLSLIFITLVAALFFAV